MDNLLMRSRLGAALALIATIVAFVLAIWWVGEAVTNTGPMHRPEFGWAEFWLSRYQTLIGAGAALYAAWYAGRWVQRQIHDARRAEIDRLARESYAARAVLPLALSSVANYANDCIGALVALKSAATLGSSAPVHFHIPTVPDDAVRPLQQAVRFALEATVAKELADLLGRFQIQRSRPLSLQRDLATPGSRVIITQHTIHDAIYDAAQLHALAARWFLFGRRSEEGDLARASADEIRSTLRINGFFEEQEPDLFHLIELYDRR